MKTQEYTGTLVVMTCPAAGCGAVYGLDREVYDRRLKDGKSWYCTGGHSLSFTKSDLDRERERAEKAEQRLKWAEARESVQRREREVAERQARAYKGHVTRLRNRIAAGVCPVQSCRRNFVNVKAHIESQHPEWAHDHPEVLT